MKSIWMTSKIFSWLFSRTLKTVFLGAFNVVVATVFVAFFFSVGINVYQNMVNRYKVTSKYEQLELFVSQDISEEEKSILINNVERYRICYNVEDIIGENKASIGVYEISDSFLFEKSCEEGFLAISKSQEQDGAIISESYQNKIGMKLEEIGKRKVTIQNGSEKIKIPIIAVLNPELDDIWTNYYSHDIYIAKDLLGNSDDLLLQMLSVEVNDSKKYINKINGLNCFILNGKEEKNQYIRIAKIIKRVVMFFGILFAFLAALGIIDANRNLINKNLNKIYLMICMGFSMSLVKKLYYYMGLLVGAIGSIIGFLLLNKVFLYFLNKYQGQMIYNINIIDLMCCNYKVILITFFVVEMITLFYMYIVLKKVTSETIISGLNEME